MADALDGVRILDLCGGLAGALGVLPLAEHGAEVIKAEPPAGDPFRRHPGSRSLNRSRRSVAMDPGPELRALAASADVVVESWAPGVLDRMGIGWEVLHADNPALVLVSCPPYPAGHRLADRPGWDALVQASSGLMWEQPGWRTGPVFLHLPVPSVAAASLVSTAVLAGLAARARTGRGQHVSTSLFQGALLYTTQLWQEVERGGRAYHEVMAKTYPPGIHQNFVYECAGGQFLHLSILSGLTPTRTVDEVIGFDGPDPLTAMAMSAAERAVLDSARRQAFREWSRDRLIEELRAANHAVEAIVPAHEMLDHPQTLANGAAVTVDDPEVGATRQVGVTIHLLDTPGRVRGPQPAVGSHQGAFAPTTPRAPIAATDSGGVGVPGSPLEGVRVLDIGQYLAGPFAPMILGDLGAEVIKLEPVTGDNMRATAKAFIGCQRGKRSIAVDLKRPEGIEIALRLAAGADIVHHNMTRGVATRLGIDYPACRAVRPDIIYCNTYAYGLPDPLGRFGGLDPIFQASSGIEYEAGAVADGGRPLYLRFGLCDISNAMQSLIGVLLALLHRQHTGEGQELWTSLHDGGLILSSDVWTGADGAPWDRPHLDVDLMGVAPCYRLYRTADDGWICVAAVGASQWERLCAAAGVADLAAVGGWHQDAAVTERLEAAFRGRTARLWHLALDEAGVPNEIPADTYDGSTVLHDADNVRLGLVVEHDHPVLGRLRQCGRFIHFSATDGFDPAPPPLVGQHTRQILRSIGYRDGDIDGLIAGGIAYEPDDGYRWVN